MNTHTRVAWERFCCLTNILIIPFFYFLSGLFVVASFLLSSCETKKPAEKHEVVKAPSIGPAPAFAEDSAYNAVAEQVAFGPRVPNSVAHVKCGDFIISELKNSGIEVKVQEFEAKSFQGKQQRLRNIIGIINPQAAKRILLITHWDTRPFADKDSSDKNKPIDGANDGASGVGILLEVARSIAKAGKKPAVGVDFLFVDGEDGGRGQGMEGDDGPDTWCLGAQYWSKNKHVPGYAAYYGILIDMVGAKGAHFALEGTSMQYAADLNNKIWEIANQSGFGSYFIFQKVESITDDHSYINEEAKIPTVDIIDYDIQRNSYFGWYHHTHHDNLSIIDKQTLKAVGQTLLNVIYSEE